MKEFPFNSNRKWQSVILKDDEGKIYLYCKGADQVMFERIKWKENIEDKTSKIMTELASEGLWTLVIA